MLTAAFIPTVRLNNLIAETAGESPILAQMAPMRPFCVPPFVIDLL